MEELVGTFDITFINNQELSGIVISNTIITSNGAPLLLLGEDGRIYNWNTIISMKPTA